ncbi:hypothetical protein UCRPC4_g03100 [Phaeomoniella chlamydospora]|uniref:DUF7053 domain-containing protein n=1 Tax=Phaeomoniella chlamydospora TaxID=158046 RepID=A0A0G2EK91_PHACM|nr:hypothetical protein UCRPC4_g03100 [Phaeomoniella chlamydospora]
MLHDHGKMIELSPLVIKVEKVKPPRDAPADEFHCSWYEVTEKISYLPGVSGNVSFHVCFNDLTNGVQCHVHAPLGLDIQEKWTIAGNLPGEPREQRELGIDAPRDVLYIREDVNMNVSRIFSSFTKSKLTKSHSTLVDRLIRKGEIIEDQYYSTNIAESRSTQSQSDTSSIRDRGPLSSPGLTYTSTPSTSPSPHLSQSLSNNPYRVSAMSGYDSKFIDANGLPSPPMYSNQQQQYYHPHQTPYPDSKHSSLSTPPLPQSRKTFIAELPGNVPTPTLQEQQRTNSPQSRAELYSPGRPPSGGMKFGNEGK